MTTAVDDRCKISRHKQRTPNRPFDLSPVTPSAEILLVAVVAILGIRPEPIFFLELDAELVCFLRALKCGKVAQLAFAEADLWLFTVKVVVVRPQAAN